MAYGGQIVERVSRCKEKWQMAGRGATTRFAQGQRLTGQDDANVDNEMKSPGRPHGKVRHARGADGQKAANPPRVPRMPPRQAGVEGAATHRRTGGGATLCGHAAKARRHKTAFPIQPTAAWPFAPAARSAAQSCPPAARKLRYPRAIPAPCPRISG